MSHYAKGTRFEHKTRDDLTENGYAVMRAAGSKGDSKIDLIGIKPGQLLFTQCKRDGKLGPGEWNRLYEVARMVGAIPLLAANGPRGRGVVYTELLGPKIPRARTQPCRPFLLDEIAAAPVPVTAELPSGTDETLAWMRRHGLGPGAGVGAVLVAVRADLLPTPVVVPYESRQVRPDLDDIPLPGLEVA